MNKLISVFVLAVMSLTTQAQDGYSSASVSLSRTTPLLSANMVQVDEYINYHRHRIPLPKNQEEIALSTDYHSLANGNIAFQVGLATEKLLDFSAIPKINISLVIDKSGSMQSGNRLEKVKKAIRKFVHQLRSEDLISLVVYDTKVQVLLPSTKVGDIENIDAILNNIYPSGSTNLHEGLMSGYNELTKNFVKNGTNKVILLTDGICNVGVVDVEEIVRQSGMYNNEGIFISTIGVGANVNFNLLHQLAKQGKGANHFIGDTEEDFTKVFENEIESLISPIAKNVSLKIIYPKGLKLLKVYGYEAQAVNNTISIPLKNLNSGLTQVILFEFEVISNTPSMLNISLNAYSFQKKKEISLMAKTRLQTNTQSTDVLKNYTVAELANSLKKAAKNTDSHDFQAGLAILNRSLVSLNNRFPEVRDPDIIRIKNIVERSKNNIETFLKHRDLAQQE